MVVRKEQAFLVEPTHQAKLSGFQKEPEMSRLVEAAHLPFADSRRTAQEAIIYLEQ